MMTLLKTALLLSLNFWYSGCVDSRNQVICKNGKVIDEKDVCDGYDDCGDHTGQRGRDEEFSTCANVRCPPGASFQCAYGGCIDDLFKCNGAPDCWDNSDEDDDLCGYPPMSCQIPAHSPHLKYEDIDCYTNETTFHKRVKHDKDSCVKFSCEEGFILSDYKKKYISKCQNGTWNPKIPRCIGCGWEEDETVRQLIFLPAGKNIKPEPWFASLYANKIATCGGTIVHSRAIVTAAHCFTLLANDEFKFQDRFNISDLRIAVGKLYTNYSHKEDSQQILEVEEVRVRDDGERYNSFLQSDIAIIITKEHINFATQVVKPVCIDQSIKDINTAQLSGKVVGFGLDEKMMIPEQLFYADFKICCESDTCKNLTSELSKKYIRPDKFCVNPSDNKGKELGKGDSGGGFIIKWKDRHYLFGIVSAKIDDPTKMMILTKVSYHTDWLMENLEPRINK